jgi:hypothetical protein
MGSIRDTPVRLPILRRLALFALVLWSSAGIAQHSPVYVFPGAINGPDPDLAADPTGFHGWRSQGPSVSPSGRPYRFREEPRFRSESPGPKFRPDPRFGKGDRVFRPDQFWGDNSVYQPGFVFRPLEGHDSADQPQSSVRGTSPPRRVGKPLPQPYYPDTHQSYFGYDAAPRDSIANPNFVPHGSSPLR